MKHTTLLTNHSVIKAIVFLKKIFRCIWINLEKLKTIAIISAIIIGGIWTYQLFIKERKDYPHADIEQRISHIKLSSSMNLLRVEIALNNKGNCLLETNKSTVRIQQILPIIDLSLISQLNTAVVETVRKDDRFVWPLLYERISEIPLEIEPGEKEVVDFEFVILSEIEVVRVYSYIGNEKKKDQNGNEIGWLISNYYDFKKDIKERDK